jgi:hypothetical protein
MAGQDLFMHAITQAIRDVPERYGGYRTDLLETIAEIVSLERNPPYNVVVRVVESCDNLGALVNERVEGVQQ